MKRSLLLSGLLIPAVLLCAPPAGWADGGKWQRAQSESRRKREQKHAASGAADRARADRSDPAVDSGAAAGGGSVPYAEPYPEETSGRSRRRAKVDPPLSPYRPIPSEEVLHEQIAAGGPIDEDMCIRMAIANQPELRRRRADVAIARAKKLGATDWPNPELRIGYVWDYDDRLREPFVERSTERIRREERYNSGENSSSVNQFGSRTTGSQRSSGTQRESRYRTIERRVRPGATRDVIDTVEYETIRETDRRRQNTRSSDGIFTNEESESRTQNTRRRIVERSREYSYHPDDTSRDDELTLMIRWDLPNFWERRALIEQAAGEIARAEADYLVEEDKVILKVREMFEELTTLEATLRTHNSRRSIHERYRADVERLNLPELANLAGNIRQEIHRLRRNARELRSDIARVRGELAAFCRIEDASRIAVPPLPGRRIVSADALDVDYLVSMALLHRSDLLDLQARHQLAQAELKGAKAMRIPSLSFVDFGWARTETSGRTGHSDEWMVRAGIVLPLFDWIGVNRAHKEFEVATKAFSDQIEYQRRLIEVEVRQALARIRAQEDEMASLESDLKAVREDGERSILENSGNVSRQIEFQYETDDEVARYEEDRVEVRSDYTKAVLALETALGARLERVLALREVTPVRTGK